MITKKFNVYEAKAVKLQNKIVGDEIVTEQEALGTIRYVAERDNVGTARHEFALQGYELPPGTKFIIKAVDKIKYACTFNDFMSMASPVD